MSHRHLRLRLVSSKQGQRTVDVENGRAVVIGVNDVVVEHL